MNTFLFVSSYAVFNNTSLEGMKVICFIPFQWMKNLTFRLLLLASDKSTISTVIFPLKIQDPIYSITWLLKHFPFPCFVRFGMNITESIKAGTSGKFTNKSSPHTQCHLFGVKANCGYWKSEGKWPWPYFLFKVLFCNAFLFCHSFPVKIDSSFLIYDKT